MSRIKTQLFITVNNKEYNVRYTGSFDEPEFKSRAFKHDEMLMRMLIADRKLFDFMTRIYMPVARFYKREDRKKSQMTDVKLSTFDFRLSTFLPSF